LTLELGSGSSLQTSPRKRGELTPAARSEQTSAGQLSDRPHHTAVDAQGRAGGVATAVITILGERRADVAALLATIIELTVENGAENYMEDR
jgi:hypothetical protein